MIKLGKIPPHFIYFLNREGILLSDFQSGNLSEPNNYDRFIAHIPYCLNYIDIQIIFDPFYQTKPPDFIILSNSIFIVKYSEIIQNFNFRASESLFNSLFKIESAYSAEMEKRLSDTVREERAKDYSVIAPHFFGNSTEMEAKNRSNILDYSEKILFFIKNNISEYKTIDKVYQRCDIYFEKNNSENNTSFATSIKQIIIAYPLDIYIRSKKIKRCPYLNICVPLNEVKFYIKLHMPNYVGKYGLQFKEEKEDLINFKSYILGYEKFVMNEITKMLFREEIINFLLSLNLGFILEVDTKDFLYLALLFIYEKSGQSFILKFIFNNDNCAKFEFQVLDIKLLEILVRTKIVYDKDILKKIKNLIVSVIVKCLKK